MIKSIGTCILMLLMAFTAESQSVSIAEKLGYPKDAKLLIIHADDLGVAHSENAASIQAMENGSVNSASIMVPCPWFPEIAKYASSSQKDFGLHLTLTSEWENYKWGPVSSRNDVSSLVNSNGYFYSSVDSVGMFASADHARLELQNQVKKALAAGIDVTHLDTHMGAVMATPEILQVYVDLGREFELPVLMPKEIRQTGISLTDKDVVVDALFQAYPDVYHSGMREYYNEVLTSLSPGLSCLLIHVAYNNEEMKAVTLNKEYWGSAWRQIDYEYFTSPECAEILTSNNIYLVTWKEIRDKIIR
jgi:chitin disaccharide deacetylase